MPKPAERLDNLPVYFFAVLTQRIQTLQAQGVDVISLDIGSPDLPPPEPVVEALAQSARKPNTHGYSGYRGIPEFRKAVSRYYERRFGVQLNSDTEVLALIGSKEGIVNLSLAYLGAGDSALIPDISYPSYSMGARIAGGDVHWLPLSAKTGFLPDITSVPDSVADHAKLLWVNYPNNPTGATATLDLYQEMVDWSNKHDILLVSDNPYVDVTYDGFKASSVLQANNAKNCTIEFMSFSKTFNMGGWRLGAAVGNAIAIKTLLQVKSNMDSGHFRPIYDAGIVALDTTPQSWIDERNMVYQRRRDRIIETLPHIGLKAAIPKGSLYVWAEVEDGDGDNYVKQALDQAHIGFAPGSAYGTGGKKYIRISLGISDERLEAALERLKTWYPNRKPLQD
ncbi:MAG: aminotransferase class I/II-fold pyridoxal phosphate-dependent enzyme [Chloroflexi bacterium]|nr:aminotransferase class I/II-fold pyridoxal phosphate-dependent enzyme [Chloroflexota bacterium]MCC6891291.1 aminotransferase class I/II-fold pyridoxal phosphate-dependent enzyme [Anaerolineae bacterium]